MIQSRAPNRAIEAIGTGLEAPVPRRREKARSLRTEAAMFEYLPSCVIITHAALNLIELHEFVWLFKLRAWTEMATLGIVFLSTVVLSIEFGIGFAVIISFCLGNQPAQIAQYSVRLPPLELACSAWRMAGSSSGLKSTQRAGPCQER